MVPARSGAFGDTHEEEEEDDDGDDGGSGRLVNKQKLAEQFRYDSDRHETKTKTKRNENHRRFARIWRKGRKESEKDEK